MRKVNYDQMRKLREAAGMTQEQVAQKMNRSVNQYNGYECGRSNPSEPIVELIAGALGVSADKLYAFGADTVSAERRSFQEILENLTTEISTLLGYPCKVEVSISLN